MVLNHQQFLLEFTHHPVRSTKGAARYLLMSRTPPLGETLLSKIALPIPRLSKVGMPRVARLGRFVQSRTVPINKERFADIYRWLRIFEQTTPPLRGCPSLLRRGLSLNQT